MDLAKHDLSVTRGGRTFQVRAYLDNQDPLGAGWHAIVVEHRTPLAHALPVTSDPETCLTAAVSFVDDAIAAEAMRGDGEQDRGHVNTWESEGGASANLHHPVRISPLGEATVII
jgi:hypothetical protein